MIILLLLLLLSVNTAFGDTINNIQINNNNIINNIIEQQHKSNDDKVTNHKNDNFENTIVNMFLHPHK